MASLPFLPLVQEEDAGLLTSCSLLAPLLVPISQISSYLKPSSKSTLSPSASFYALSDEKTSADQIIDVLNEGVQKAVVTPSVLKELNNSIPKDRLILLASGESDVNSSLIASVGGIFFTSPVVIGQALTSRLSPLQIFILSSSTSLPSSAQLSDAFKASTTFVIPTTSLTTSDAPATDKLSLASAFLAPLNTDRPDGLFPTIVTSSTHSGKSLGLVYSSKESLKESINSLDGVYQSRKHGLWRKGATSGATQRVTSIKFDCDSDAIIFGVEQSGTGFCHLGTDSCFGQLDGIAKLEDTLKQRLVDAPEGSYTKRLFNDEKLLQSKIMEEADELCTAKTKEEIAFEAADLIYFAMTRCVKDGVGWADIERALDSKSLKVKRRKGDAKPQWDVAAKEAAATKPTPSAPVVPVPNEAPASNGAELIKMRTSILSTLSPSEKAALLLRPVLDSSAMLAKVSPIIDSVRKGGDEALLEFTHKFDRVPLTSNIILPPFKQEDMNLPEEVRIAIDQAYENVKKFHSAQAEKAPLVVETMPGVVCTRFARAIERVGIYVPGGTAVLPSTAIMLGVPAQVAGCSTIVLATPPRSDGSITPEIMYVAKLIGASVIVKAGGAQAVAALAYGTKSVPKVDKIFGPGNQWVTAAKMLVQNDTTAMVGIDMPAGPSEVLVMVDMTCNPVFVASDLLSQAEHGVDSQVVLVAIDLTADKLADIEQEVDSQARALPRCEIARQAIAKSLIVKVQTRDEAIVFSNDYAPEHLIIQMDDAPALVPFINNAGSVFVGHFSPESCGDYASGTNHTLPTYGYARQFSGVNTLSFQKHITSQELTKAGLSKLGPTVVTLAECEGLEAHANAVRVRLAALAK